MHQRQHAIAAGLQRIVEVLAHGGAGRHGSERMRAHVLGVRACEPHPTQTRHGADRRQKIREQRPQPCVRITIVASCQLNVAAVAIDVLAQQSDLRDPAGNQRLHFRDDVVERAADFNATNSRHDAERAVVVAADLDRHPRVVAGLASSRQCTGEHRMIVEHSCIENLDELTVRL